SRRATARRRGGGRLRRWPVGRAQAASRWSSSWMPPNWVWLLDATLPYMPRSTAVVSRRDSARRRGGYQGSATNRRTGRLPGMTPGATPHRAARGPHEDAGTDPDEQHLDDR